LLAQRTLVDVVKLPERTSIVAGNCVITVT
jgi:hypothetical protein